jgi:hypothetical protein
VSDKLTIAEVDRYVVLKDAIASSLSGEIEAGYAIAEIRESRLYRDEYPTFEDFCKGELEIARSRAYQLIQYAEVAKSITYQPCTSTSTIGGRTETQAVDNKAPLPANERQYRELAKVREDRRAEVMREVAATGEKQTAKLITETAKRIGAFGGTNGITKKTLVLCDRCLRTGPVAGCNRCKEARKQAKKPKAAAKQTDDLKDHFGNAIPKRCRDAWADTWMRDAFHTLCVFADEFREKRLADGMNKRKKHYPFTNAKDFIDGLGFIDNYLDQVITHLKETRPAGVCPACEGKGCGRCLMSGLVPRELYLQMKESA